MRRFFSDMSRVSAASVGLVVAVLLSLQSSTVMTLAKPTSAECFEDGSCSDGTRLTWFHCDRNDYIDHGRVVRSDGTCGPDVASPIYVGTDD